MPWRGTGFLLDASWRRTGRTRDRRDPA